MNVRECMPNDIDAQAEHWFALMLDPGCRAERQAQFDAWLQADPAHVEAWRRAERLWWQLGEAVQQPAVRALAEAAPPQAPAGGAEPRHWAALRFAPRPRAPRWRRAPRLAAAAAVLALAALGLHGWRQREAAPPSPPPSIVYESAVGEARSVALPDGSIVTLDTDSRIAVSFRPDRRNVRLERGAVFLDVTPDPLRPFNVATAMGSVTVLGTQFQVRQDADALRVVLVKGAVRLDADPERPDDVPPTILRPGQQAWRGAGAAWTTAAAEPESTAWRQGRLIFRATPLARAVAEVNRYTPRKLHIDDPALASLGISGVFRTGDPDSFAMVLENSLPVRVERGADGMRVRKRTR